MTTKIDYILNNGQTLANEADNLLRQTSNDEHVLAMLDDADILYSTDNASYNLQSIESMPDIDQIVLGWLECDIFMKAATRANRTDLWHALADLQAHG